MKAIIQGDFHTSRKDKELLNQRISSDVDSVFIEGRSENIGRSRITLPYVLFITGALLLFWLHDVVGPDELEPDVPKHDNIDIPLPELYDRIPDRIIWGAFVLLGFTGYYLAFVSLADVPFVAAPRAIDFVYALVITPILILGTPILYSGLIIIYENRIDGARNSRMAERIDSISQDEGYDTIVVSCGQAHLYSLESQLAEKGWQIETYDSSKVGMNILWRLLD